MRFAAILIELLHLLAGVAATAAVFAAAAWAYPPAAATLRMVGWVTMAAVIGMSVPAFKRAWARGTISD